MNQKMKRILNILICLSLLIGCITEPKSDTHTLSKNKPAKVILLNNEGNYQLLVNNEPFYIKGAGLEFGNIPALAKHNGNSFRTWRIENGRQSGKEVLDEAHKYGLMVTMGIEVARERHGFDYNNESAVKEQLEQIKKDVIALKDHPALLLWGIGNELNLRYTNPKVWDAVNEISQMIHEVDPNHLTTTSLAGISKKEITLIKEKCPDLDLLSFQMYGSLEHLPRMIKEYDYTGPYIVTEWGATGHWEVPTTKWGVPIEENSSVKASNYLNRYYDVIEANKSKCLGSYVFLWGQKQERTPTWYGLFLENGSETESVDVMHFIWNNEWPANRTPQITAYTLDNKTAYESVELQKNKAYTASILIKDFENDSINYSWELLRESTDLKDGGDKEERPEALKIEIVKQSNGELIFKSPDEGKYRLFVYVDDGQDHEATANIPFIVL